MHYDQTNNVCTGFRVNFNQISGDATGSNNRDRHPYEQINGAQGETKFVWNVLTYKYHQVEQLEMSGEQFMNLV